MLRKVIILVSIIICSAVLMLPAEETQTDQWWLDKPIYSIRFEGLDHVDESEIRQITNQYLGKRYTSDLFSSLQSELFNLQYFAYFSAQAEKGGETGEDLVIIFQFVELPIISNLSITGNSTVRTADIEDVLTISEESFATSAKIKENEKNIRDLYLSKGFTSVEIVSNLVTNTEENTISLTVLITEGLQSKIGAINFSGNQRKGYRLPAAVALQPRQLY